MQNLILIQGAPCTGKSALLRTLETSLENCKIISVDKNVENLWDRYGFKNTHERDSLYKAGVQESIKKSVKSLCSGTYTYVILEGVFNEERMRLLENSIKVLSAQVKTVYLYPIDGAVWKDIWTARSRNFSVRHPGHGASYYRNGTGGMYTNKCKTNYLHSLRTLGETLECGISFKPYSRSKSDKEIIDFITK